jgi:adenosine deaminase
MEHEYARLADAFDWDDGVFRTIAQTSLDAAFCDPATKAKLKTKLESAND